MSEISTEPLRMALRAMTHGVYVLSVRHAERDEYLIVSLAMQCSIEPPRIAIAVSKHARILAPLRLAGGGVLSVLDAGQIAAVRRYGTPGGTRNAATAPERSALGHPRPDEAACWLGLQVAQEVSAGDHVLFILNVLEAGCPAAAFEPLTLAAGKFRYGG